MLNWFSGLLCNLQNSPVLSVIEMFGNIGVILITVYSFVLGFLSKRITFESMTHHYSHRGDSLTILVKNHSMRSFFIKEVNLIIDNTRSLKIRERNDDPIELSPLGVAIIKMQPYSQLENDFKVPMMYEEKMFLILNMASEKPIIARVPKHFTSRKHKKYEPVMVHTNTYNGIILQPGDKYALHYFSKPSESEEKTIIIHESGVMSDSLPQYNAETHEFSIFNGIPTETANSFEETKKLFEEVSKPFGSKVQLVELEKRLP